MQRYLMRCLAQPASIFSLLVLLCVLLSGCASQEGLKKDIARLQKEIQDIRSFQAEQTSRITALERGVRDVVGHVEEVEYSQSHKLSGDVDSLKRDIRHLRRRVPPPPIVPIIALEADETLASRLPAEISRVFGNALLRVREGNFAEALPLLNETVQLSSGREWLPNLIFWTAVVFDGSGDARRALSAYHEVVAQYPEHPRSALALLRQASVFVRLKDSQSAKLTLQKLIAQFPQTTEARQARERLKKL